MPHIKLINLLIRELHHCSLRGDFRVSRPAEIFQFDRFPLKINFKRACNCNYGIPRLGSNLQFKKKYTRGPKGFHEIQLITYRREIFWFEYLFDLLLQIQCFSLLA